MVQMRAYPFPPEELKRLAITDELTGLYNRRYFKFRLNEEMERARRSDREMAVLLLDLDGLKSVNDLYGHLRGDRLLMDFAEILSSSVRPFDLVARFAGDEFIILLPECGQRDVLIIAERIRSAVAETVFAGDPVLKVTTSIGLAIFPVDGDEADSLIASADKGLYTAKRLGRNRVANAKLDKDEKDAEIRLSDVRIIGRDEELFQMVRTLTDVVNGRSACVFVSGEPGVGKTRILNEFISRATQTGAVVFSETCFDHTRFIPYQPIREMIRRYFAQHSQLAYRHMIELSEFQRTEFLTLLPDLDPVRLEIHNGMSRNPGQEEFHLFDAISHYFRRIAGTAPLVICLDDIQCLDEASTKFLIYLMRNARDDRILLVGTCREGDMSETGPGHAPFIETLNAFKSIVRVISVGLTRLNRARTRELVNARIGQALPAEFTDRIHRESEGNPFFIEEMLKALIESRLLYRTPNGWQIGEISKVEAPPSIREMISARLTRLDAEDRQILSIAAVIGWVFDFDTLQLVTGRNEGHLLDVLERLEHMQLIVRETSGRATERYRFAHNKIREVLYEEMESRRRRMTHQSVTAALERLHQGNTELVAGELIYHYTKAGMVDQAVALCFDAGDKAYELHAEGSAIRYFSSGLKLVGSNPEKYFKEISLLHEKLGVILTNQGRSVRAIKEFASALDRGKGSLTPLRRAQIHRQMAEIYVNNGRVDETIQQIDHAEQYLDPEQDRIERLRLEICKCKLLLHRGEYEACLEQSNRSIETLRSIDQSIELSDFLDLAGDAEHYLGHRDSAVRLYSESLELRRDRKDLARISRSYSKLAGMFLEGSRWEDALIWYFKSIKIEENLNHVAALADPYERLSVIYMRKGDTRLAADYIKRSLDIRELSRDIPGIVTCLSIMISLFIEDGKLNQARDLLARAEEYNNDYDLGVSRRDLSSARISMLLAEGDLDGARQRAIDFQEVNELFGDPHGRAKSAFLLGRVERVRSDSIAALQQLQFAYPIYVELGNRYEAALCLLEQGMVHKHDGNFILSSHLLTEARDIFSDIGSERERTLAQKWIDSDSSSEIPVS